MLVLRSGSIDEKRLQSTLQKVNVRGFNREIKSQNGYRDRPGLKKLSLEGLKAPIGKKDAKRVNGQEYKPG